MTNANDNLPAAANPQPCEDTWVILFEEADKTAEVFTGNGAETAALQRFAALKHNWACSLFREYRHESPGRIDILGWREHGDDDDSTLVTVFAADDQTTCQELLESEGVTFGEGNGYTITEETLTDGQIMTSHDGRRFRVSIEEVR